MKQVLFICLFSVSLCLSAPQNGTPSADPAKHEEAPPPTLKPQLATTNTQGNAVTTAHPGSTPTAVTEGSPKPANEPNASPKDKDHETTAPPTTKPTEKAPSDKTPQTSSTTASITTSAVPVSTTMSSTTKHPASTEPEHKATVPPKTPEPIPVRSRGFDGASFVGGIILTLGLLAIGFMGFKYYKNQTERNYHTL